MPLWVAGLASAFLLKLTSSIDDVVWLAPFLTSNNSTAMQTSNAVIYLSVCMTQTLVAMFLAYSGDKTVDYLLRNRKDAWSSDRILTVTAGTLLALYAVKLTYEYFTESSEEEGGEAAAGEAPKNEYDQVAGADPDAEGGFKVSTEKPAKELSNVVERGTEVAETPGLTDGLTAKEKANQSTLFVIAFIGSVDDLTVFVPMLVGKAFDLVQLMLGSFTAALSIVLLCIFVGMCKPVADCLSAIPLALIVAVFATTLLVKGYLME
jgi:hypothetical protein